MADTSLQIFLQLNGATKCLEIERDCRNTDFFELVGSTFDLKDTLFHVCNLNSQITLRKIDGDHPLEISGGSTYIICANVVGGIDFQHREGSKIGSGGQLSEAQAAIERRERLRKLALETIDISKDPYFMRNHLGTYECKLCLTLHNNEGNYLAHTQGKRHQSNLGRRAAMEAKNAPAKAMVAKEVIKKRVIKIGRPGYKVSSDDFKNFRIYFYQPSHFLSGHKIARPSHETAFVDIRDRLPRSRRRNSTKTSVHVSIRAKG